MTAPKRWRVLLAATLFCLSGTASAEDAKTLLAKGNQLFSQGDYLGAYTLYQQGHKKTPNAVFLRSMAFSLLKLYRHEEALASFAEYLKKYPAAKDKKEIKEMAEGLRVVVETRISVTSTPPGAAIFFDIEAGGAAGTTPYKGTITPGKHTVLLKLPGYHLTAKAFTIQPRQSISLEVPLEVPLKVTSRPEGAEVRLGSADAPSMGVTPLEGGIVPGTHAIILQKPGYKTHTATGEARAGATLTVAAELKLGLKVASTPPDAQVLVDGQAVVGSTPLELEMTPGKHMVEIRLAGFKPFSQEVVVAPGAEAVVEATLRGGLLTMRTPNAEKAKVVVGGQTLGETPLEQVTVPLGEQVVTLEHPGHRSWHETLSFDENEMVDARVQMAGPRWPTWASLAVGGAGILLGSVFGLVARNEKNENAKLTREAGRCTYLNPDGSTNDSECNFTYHHLSTASFTIGITSAAFAILYHYLWGQPHQEIRRVPVDRTAMAPAPAARAH